MATLYRIYDQTVGQLAGFLVTTDSKAIPKADGTQALAQAVVMVDSSGAAITTTDINVAKINGIAPLMGNGVTGTGSQRVTIASDNTPFTTKVLNVSTVGYETVAASQTGQVLGGSGATGDFLVGILVIPGTTSPGNVIVLDNAISITIFTGGASSVSNLVPFMIPIGANSVSGAWKLTTGSNVTCVAIGNFT